jgi:hypothetical protein
MCKNIWLEYLKGSDCSEDQGVDRRIILELILRKEIGGEGWTGFMWLGTGPVVGSCEHSNAPSGSIKGRV